MVSYENTITFIFFIPALLCILIGLFSMLTCGCCCFCNNEQESPPPIRQRRRARRRDNYIRMSDCESTDVTPRSPANWRCRGNGHPEPTHIYRDRRLCANFDMMVGPAPPSYTVSMQHHYNYIWNQPTTAVARGTSNAGSSVRMVESNHSHVHNVSLIRMLSGAEDSEETRLDEVEENEEGEEEGEEEEGRDGSSSPPPSYNKTETTNRVDSH